MTFQKNRNNTLNNNINRDIGRQIFNGLWLQQQVKRNLDSDLFYHYLKKAQKKSAMIAWEICNHVFPREKNLSKGLNFKKSEVKPLKVLIVASFEGEDEKAQYASFKHIFI